MKFDSISMWLVANPLQKLACHLHAVEVCAPGL
jgi:hypothetical protein